MIYRLVIRDSECFDKSIRAHKIQHSYWWTEGEDIGGVLQHANLWMHPCYAFAQMQFVLRRSIHRGNLVDVWRWNRASGQWELLD